MNIVLKKIEKDDLELLRKWRMQENVTKYMLTDPIISIEDEINWYNKIMNDDTREDYVIMADNIRIGYYGITNIDRNLKSCYIGFYIGDDNYRGKGLFKEIQAMAEDIIINELKLMSINIEVLENNPIIKTYYKIGFENSNLINRHIVKNGESLVVINLNKQTNKQTNIIFINNYLKLLMQIYCRKCA